MKDVKNNLMKPGTIKISATNMIDLQKTSEYFLFDTKPIEGCRIAISGFFIDAEGNILSCGVRFYDKKHIPKIDELQDGRFFVSVKNLQMQTMLI